MKQLLIVNSAAALNGGMAAPKDIAGMVSGGIGFYALNDLSAWLAAKPTTNFGIALGRGSNNTAIVVPEVDVKTLKATITEPSAATIFTASITVPTPAEGKDYTLVLVKKGVVFNERNKFTATYNLPKGKTATAADVAQALRKQFKDKADVGGLNISVTGSGAVVTLTGTDADEQWTLTAGDDLAGTTITETPAAPAIGDKKYIMNLASKCAADKGFKYTMDNGSDVYPGYPEPVEDKQYTVVTLKFAVGRDSAKTRDEVVNQVVHIAIPADSPALDTIKDMFTETPEP
jgi:hypothetical protein